MSDFASRLALQPADQFVPTILFSSLHSDTDDMKYGQGTDRQVSVSDADGMKHYQANESQVWVLDTYGINHHQGGERQE